MKEKNEGASKNKWSRMFRKKWFFPAVYLIVAALLLTVVLWYQSLDNQIPQSSEEPESTENYTPTPNDDEDAESVLDQQETIKMPVADKNKIEIVTKFYDYNAEEEDQEDALILYNNKYQQSTGIDIAAADGESFDVLAALSGTVIEVKEDPALGKIVILEHENDVSTYYSSLGEMNVKAGERVKQDDVLGVSGKNIIGKDNGNHVHFELRKNGEVMNPETFFNQPVSKLDEYVGQDQDDDSEDDPDEKQNNLEEDADQNDTEDENADQMEDI